MLLLANPTLSIAKATVVYGDGVERDNNGRLAFWSFILLNAVLFLRPGDMFPALQTDPGLYELIIYLCLVVSLPRILSQLSVQSLLSRPTSLCMVGLQGAVVASALLNSGPGVMLRSGIEFGKLLVYYFLLVGVVDTPKRLRTFVYCVGGLIFVVTLLALLQYHAVIDIPALSSLSERQWEDIGEEVGSEGVTLIRLCAAGIFNNPNDLAKIIMVGVMIAIYGLGDRRSLCARHMWLILIGVFGYALTLTYSRGGFLSLLVALIVFLIVRFRHKAIGIALIVLPALFLLFAGRTTSITTRSGTGLQRIEIWRDGFQLWRDSPIFGIGMNNFGDELGIVAHNSFVHAYTELGLVGGTFFLGAFYLGAVLPYRVDQLGSGPTVVELSRFRPYLVGIVAGYAMGMMASSRNYDAPTYMLVGLAAIYMNLVAAYLGRGYGALNGRLMREVVLVSGLTVTALYVFIRVSLAGA